MGQDFSLEKYELTVERIIRNAPPSRLYEHGLRNEAGTAIASSGGIIAMSGEKTGRSPKDKRIVDRARARRTTCGGARSTSSSTSTVFMINRERAIDYLNTRAQLYVVDGFAGWDPQHRIKVRVICSRAYHALFMHNMLIRPTPEELESFGEPDYVIFNAGAFQREPLHVRHDLGKTSVDLHFGRREFVILGTEYAGEMKKGVFTIMNYLMPKRGVLSMHCSANEAKQGRRRRSSSACRGTGKTTLVGRSEPPADRRRRALLERRRRLQHRGRLLRQGDQPLGRSTSRRSGPRHPLRRGARERGVRARDTGRWTYATRRSPRTRAAATPIEYIPNAKIPCVARPPEERHLPDLRRLRRAAAGQQADARAGDVPLHQRLHRQGGGHRGGCHRAAGDVQRLLRRAVPGLAPDQVRRDARRQAQEAQRADLARQHRLDGRPVRRRLPHEASRTRAPSSTPSTPAPWPTRRRRRIRSSASPSRPQCAGVPSEVLIPKNTWSDKAAFDSTARKLASLFKENFQQYESQASDAIRSAGPRL